MTTTRRRTIDSTQQRDWIASVPRERASLLTELWLRDGIDVQLTDDVIWLRGSVVDDSLLVALRRIADCERFDVDASGRLVPFGLRVPVDVAPEGKWTPLRAAISLKSPLRSVPAECSQLIPLSLNHGGSAGEANVLALSFAAWRAYVEVAPQVRLQSLTFAVSNAEQVVVRGLPLPSLRGQTFVEVDGVALPSGWTLGRAVSRTTVRRLCGARSTDDFLLLSVDADGLVSRVERIAEACFVAASRSAVRLTEAQFAEEFSESRDG